jgi:hypothetical protein
MADECTTTNEPHGDSVSKSEKEDFTIWIGETKLHPRWLEIASEFDTRTLNIGIAAGHLAYDRLHQTLSNGITEFRFCERSARHVAKVVEWRKGGWNDAERYAEIRLQFFNDPNMTQAADELMQSHPRAVVVRPKSTNDTDAVLGYLHDEGFKAQTNGKQQFCYESDSVLINGISANHAKLLFRRTVGMNILEVFLEVSSDDIGANQQTDRLWDVCRNNALIQLHTHYPSAYAIICRQDRSRMPDKVGVAFTMHVVADEDWERLATDAAQLFKAATPHQ